MRVEIVSKTFSFKKNEKNFDNKTIFFQNNNTDTVELKMKNPSFQGKNFARLFTEDGMLKMVNHFSDLKNREPELSDKIEAIKRFIVDFSNFSETNENFIKLGWEPIINSLPLTFNNTRYFIENEAGGLFSKKKMVASGSGKSLHELIVHIDSSHKYTSNLNNRVKTTANDLIRLFNSANKEKYYGTDSGIKAQNGHNGNDCGMKEKIYHSILNVIKEDQTELKAYRDFEELFPH